MAVWPDGVDHIALDVIDSTNKEAARRAASATRPFWCRADAQTDARGRRGRAWHSASGNFAASYLATTDLPGEELAKYSFVAALALYDALVALGVAQAKLSLKWPNDVLVEGRKISGILLETTQVQGRMSVIVGIGLNIPAVPDTADLEPQATPPTSLSQQGITSDASTVMTHLAAAFAQWETRFLREGFAPIRDAWLSRSIGLGTRITARLPGITHIGTFEDVDQNGAMVLATATGRLVLPAADVYF